MKNIARTLIYNGQVSLTIADTTEMVNEGIRLHALSPLSAYIFGKALSAMTFMSACLKEEKGEISLSVTGEGKFGEIAVSGNRALYLRGYIGNTLLEGEANEENECACVGENSAMVIIRDDGYSRPFVGTCALPKNAGIDEGFEEYFRISEQLPTRISTLVELDESGLCTFAGVIAVQPLPFADENTLKQVETLPLDGLLKKVKTQGVTACIQENFEVDSGVFEERKAEYKCNCSREYLTRILVSLGEAQMREIIQEDGAVRIHCHYCNTDYEFGETDADKIFQKTE